MVKEAEEAGLGSTSWEGGMSGVDELWEAGVVVLKGTPTQPKGARSRA